MQTIINIIVFILVLGTIITIHEFGHFIAAKHFNVYCGHFSIGFGPKIFSKKGEETEYELRLLPIGGFVSMAGEADQEDVEEFKDLPLDRTLKGKKTYQKVIIFLAGVFMNFVLAIVVLFASNIMSGAVPIDVVQIKGVEANSPASIYGLKANDVIEKIYVKDSDKSLIISDYDSFTKALSKNSFGINSDKADVVITVKRNNKNKDINMVLTYNKDTNLYYFGITFVTRHMTFIECIEGTVDDVSYMSSAIFVALGKLVTNFAGNVKNLSGPAGIYQVTAQVTESGQIDYILRLLGLLSINVGIFNLLPIPGLDGCQVLFALVERIIGREIPQNMKLVLQMIGVGLVLLLMVFVTYQDLLKLFN